jgi:hypothetical protein
MKPSRDPLGLMPHWHVDCRLEAELPEDNLIGTRFLINALFSAVAAAALLFTGWLAYLDLSLRSQIVDWDRRIRDNAAEVRDIQRMQREFAIEATKIDQAYTLIRPRLLVGDFLARIALTRPEQMTIDNIEWNEAGVVIRGTFSEKSETGSKRLGEYGDLLKRDPKLAPIFRDVQMTDITRLPDATGWKFETQMMLK